MEHMFKISAVSVIICGLSSQTDLYYVFIFSSPKHLTSTYLDPDSKCTPFLTDYIFVVISIHIKIFLTYILLKTVLLAESKTISWT